LNTGGPPNFHFDRRRRSWQLPPSYIEYARRRSFPVANPEWGTKRICQSCSTKFYDLQREPIACPKCQTEFDPEVLLKTRRSRPPAAAEKGQAPAAPAAADAGGVGIEDTEVLDDEDAVAATVVSDDDEDEALLEDASELGEDDDDMAEVIENVDEEEER
jgi:uncharacterized protein (TIGR02300 family)